MDASNPIQDSTRMSVLKLKERNHLLMRQNLDVLNVICSELPRLKLPSLPVLDKHEERERRVADVVSRVFKEKLELINNNNDPKNLSEEELGKFLKVTTPFPVCGLMREGIPLHNQSKNQQKGNVANFLTFGGLGFDRELAILWSHYLETDHLVGIVEQIPFYTNGTTAGLQVRLRQQLDRQTVNLDIPYERFKQIMYERMPVNKEKLVDYTGDIYELVEQVKTSYNSSAGAPYWKAKQDAVDDLMEVTLPLVVRALCEKGGLDKLFKENPELFLTAIKNKDDRYADPVGKTRPYVSMPWHFQILFSVICQSFSESLQLFTSKKSCWNAYGFSYAHGGGTAMAERLLSLSPNEHMVACFGDDVYFAFNLKGKIYLVCPDFKQMDGSVDAKTVEYTLRWIRESFEAKWGESQFWKNVFSLWEKFVLDPHFLVYGTSVYRKNKKGGIMSGVVGTTVFDTVKSIVAYQQLIELYGQAPSSFLDEKLMIKFFKNKGLVIKENTWAPEIIYEPQVNQLLSKLTFLGMQLQKREYNGHFIYVPTNPLDQWLNLALAPKRAELPRGAYQRARYLFDRLRGSLTSGGVFNEQFADLCNTTLSTIPAAAIVMEVMAGDGKGMRPELTHTVGDEFSYSSSQGWPMLEWALDLYAPEEIKIPGAEVMEEVFKDPTGLLKAPKKRKLLPSAIIADISVGQSIVSSSLVGVDEPDRVPVVEDFSDILQVAESSTLTQDLEPHSKSKILNYQPLRGEVSEEVKILPSLADQIKNIIGPVQLNRPQSVELMHDDLLHMLAKKNKYELEAIVKAGQFDIVQQILLGMLLDGVEITEVDKWTFCFSRMMPLQMLASRLGISEKLCQSTARGLGYYVFGSPSLSFVSPVPIAPVAPNLAEQIKEQEIQNVERMVELKKDLKNSPIDADTSKKQKAVKQLSEVVNRAEERPALLPPPVEKPESKLLAESEDFRFKYIPGFDARAAQQQNLKNKYSAARKVLSESGLTYTVSFEETSLDFYLEESGSSEKKLFHTSVKPKKQAYNEFYGAVLKKYVSDTELEKQLHLSSYNTQDWSVLAEVEDQVKVTLFKERGRPILAQISNKPAVLLQDDHEILKKPDRGEGFIIEEQGNRQLVNFKRNMTVIAKAARLNKLLGVEVETEQLTYQEFISSYSQFDQRVGVSKRLQSLSDKQRKNHQAQPKKRGNKNKNVGTLKQDGKEKQEPTKEGGSTSRSENRDNSKTAPKQKPKVAKTPPKEKPQQNQHEQGRHKKGDGQRLRLPWVHSYGPQGQNWGNQSYNQYVPYGMGWYPGPGGVQAMAAIPPQVPGGGNFHFSQQNDGGPIYSGMGGRPGRNNRNGWRRGPSQVHGSKPFKGKANKY